MNTAEGNIPQDTNPHCPGTGAVDAGKTKACEGCPSQNDCASAPKGRDPDMDTIQARMHNIKHKILVLSGKGGVGKSTVTAQLAYAYAAQGKNVGILDIDICGPSIPKLLNLEGEQIHQSNTGWSPVYADENLAVISIGFLLSSPDEAVIWRGPKKNGLIKQFVKDVNWDELDFLIVDTPPGTSDEHLSITSLLKEANPDGAIVVTTPQEVALSDVRKEINFCNKIGLPILGVIENMSGFVCPKCKNTTQIFPPSTGGAEKMAKDYDIPFLGRLPLDPQLARVCDNGKSYIQEFPDSPGVLALNNIIKNLQNHLKFR